MDRRNKKYFVIDVATPYVQSFMRYAKSTLGEVRAYTENKCTDLIEYVTQKVDGMVEWANNERLSLIQWITGEVDALVSGAQNDIDELEEEVVQKVNDHMSDTNNPHETDFDDLVEFGLVEPDGTQTKTVYLKLEDP